MVKKDRKKEETDEAKKKDKTRARPSRVDVDGADEPASNQNYLKMIGQI